MPRKVIVTECSHQSWVEIFQMLKNEHGWEPVYWTASREHIDFKQFKSSFPKCVIHDNYDAVKALPPVSFSDSDLSPIDTTILKDFAYYESIVLKMMDRMDPLGVFSYSERLQLYYRYLAYWSYVLDTVKPDIFLAPVNPHLCYDYVLYQLCRYRNIKCIIFIETNMANLVYINEDYENIPPSLISTYSRLLESTEDVELSLENQAYIDRVSVDEYSKALPIYMAEQFAKARKINEKRSFFQKAVAALRSRASSFKHEYITKLNYEPVRAYYKLRDTPVSQWPIRKQLQQYWSEREKATDHLKARYDSLTSIPAFDKQYIFVALMYQPERTSSPEGGLFNNQYLMIEWLSANAPKGYIIYVKEHPSQFIYKVDNTRESWMYDDVCKFPNVRLVSTTTDTFKLIDNSLAVATLTGSAGFEAVIRGKPLLCFGNAWYRGCEGVLWIRNLNDLRQSFNLIMNGYIPDKLKVRKYFKTLELIGIRAYVDPYYEKNLPFEENINNLKNAIHSHVQHD